MKQRYWFTQKGYEGYPHHIENINTIKENPEKVLAHQILYKEIIKGNIQNIKKLKCLFCGKKAKVYHHPDYSKPLKVIPLCSICHGLVHRKYEGLKL